VPYPPAPFARSVVPAPTFEALGKPTGPVIAAVGSDLAADAPYRVEARELNLRWRDLVSAIEA
jgi:hypothetical protein